MKFGYVHSDDWTMAGLPTSLRVPKRAAGLVPVMETMRLYYGNHPELEVAPRNITAFRIGEVLAGLKTVKAAVTAQRTILRTLRKERRELATALKRRINSLAKETCPGPCAERFALPGFWLQHSCCGRTAGNTTERESARVNR